jgi:hypothetical protein
MAGYAAPQRPQGGELGREGAESRDQLESRSKSTDSTLAARIAAWTDLKMSIVIRPDTGLASWPVLLLGFVAFNRWLTAKVPRRSWCR